MASGIFISYRRRDSRGDAGRLAADLRRALPGVQVFRDVETIEPGVDFAESIKKALDSSEVVLVMIGPTWGTALDEHGNRRLDNPNDYMRIEIETALLDSSVRVIPVLLEHAELPQEKDLPGDMKLLLRRQTFELRDARWSHDVELLIGAIRKILGIAPVGKEAAAGAKRGGGGLGKILGVAAVVVAAVVVTVVLTKKDGGNAERAGTGFAAKPSPAEFAGNIGDGPETQPSTDRDIDRGQIEERGDPEPSSRRFEARTVNLSGVWFDTENDPYNIIHSGASIQIQSQDSLPAVFYGSANERGVELGGTTIIGFPPDVQYRTGLRGAVCQYQGILNISSVDRLEGLVRFVTSDMYGTPYSFDVPVVLTRASR